MPIAASTPAVANSPPRAAAPCRRAAMTSGRDRQMPRPICVSKQLTGSPGDYARLRSRIFRKQYATISKIVAVSE